MVMGASEVVEVTRSVWSSLLGDEQELGSVDADHSAEQFVTGCVTVSGGWNGAISIGCTSRLARRVTAAMFELESDSASPAEVADAIGEIANMIGGNIKALMPGPSQLSLPAVTDRESGILVPGGELVVNESFEWGGERLRVQVLQRREPSTWSPLTKERSQ